MAIPVKCNMHVQMSIYTSDIERKIVTRDGIMYIISVSNVSNANYISYGIKTWLVSFKLITLKGKNVIIAAHQK